MKFELKALLKHFKVTAILVTHNQDEAFDIADEIGIMSGGKIDQWGNPYDLYHMPACKSVAEFLGNGTFLPGFINQQGCLQTELGDITCRRDLAYLAGRELTVLLRPDDIVHDDSQDPLAEIQRIAFRGMYQIYQLGLASGQSIYCFTSSHHSEHQLGDKIGIRLDIRHAVIFEGDQAIVRLVD